MTDPDKPTIHASLAALDTEANPEPFVYATKAGKRVTFPDPGAMGVLEAEKFLAQITSNQRTPVLLGNWLSGDDYAALMEDKLTFRQMRALMKLVQKHYGDIFGADAGEDDASTDS